MTPTTEDRILAALERIAGATEALAEVVCTETPPMEIVVTKTELAEIENLNANPPAPTPARRKAFAEVYADDDDERARHVEAHKEAATTIEILARALHQNARSRSQALTNEVHQRDFEACGHHHCEGARKMIAEIREVIG